MEARAHGIWGGEDGLQEQHAKRSEVREKKRQKKYEKEIKGLSAGAKKKRRSRFFVKSKNESCLAQC